MKHITDRGQPIAKIVAIDPEEAELIKAGGVVPARPRFAMPTRRVPADRPSATEALLAMREDDRPVIYFITYDKGLLQAAVAEGLPVAAPGVQP